MHTGALHREIAKGANRQAAGQQQNCSTEPLSDTRLTSKQHSVMLGLKLQNHLYSVLEALSGRQMLKHSIAQVTCS